MSIELIKNLFYEKLRSRDTDREKICVILGAGADISSGGLTFTELKRSCIEKFTDTHVPSLLSADRIDALFNEFLEEKVADQQRSPIMDYLFHGMAVIKPSDGYRLLVLLASEKVIDAVITTNFDNVLETAEQELNINVFQVYSPGVASPFVIGETIYLPPRPPYVKIHGDIQAKSITHLTQKELDTKEYDVAFSLLIQHIIKSHRLIFVGYSGNDPVFSREFAKASHEVIKPIYWCNIAPPNEDCSFARALDLKDVTFVKSTFEDLFIEAGTFALSNRMLPGPKPYFIAPLIKERIHYANKDFISNYGFPDRFERLKLLVTRKQVAQCITDFRYEAHKSLCVITGNSGVGKTTMLAQLFDSVDETHFPSLLILRARAFSNTDFAQIVVSYLGYSTDEAVALLYQFSGWLQAEKQQLLIAVDGLNEFSSSAKECLKLLKDIINVTTWLRSHSTIKILLTIRPETWKELYPHLDHVDLSKVLWTNASFEDTVNTIHLGKFSQTELNEAYKVYAQHYTQTTPFRQLRSSTRRILTDPYLLRLVMQGQYDIGASFVDSAIYRNAFEEVISQTFGPAKGRSIVNSLSKLAFGSVEQSTGLFTIEDLERCRIQHEERRILVELGLLEQSDSDQFRFRDDRIQEHYLARAFNSFGAKKIRNIEDLGKELGESRDYPAIASALRQCFVDPHPSFKDHYYSLAFSGLKQCLSATRSTHLPNRDILTGFLKDVVLAIASHHPDVFEEVCRNYFIEERNNTKHRAFIRTLLQACSLLKIDQSLPLLEIATQYEDHSIRTEATIFMYDKITASILLSVHHSDESTLLPDAAISYFKSSNLEPWESALRLIGIISYLGSDNTHPNEWATIEAWVSAELTRVLQGYSIEKTAVRRFSELVVKNANRFLFNSSEDIVERFFMAPSRKELGTIFDELKAGKSLTIGHLEIIRPYVDTLDQTIEFIICNLLFTISMMIDKEATVQLFETYFDLFDTNTKAEEVDFFLSSLFLSHQILGIPSQEIIKYYTEKMINDLPQAILVNPGAIRGARRGRFSDPFDQQFEDGFNPMAFYFYNAPSSSRRSYYYTEYLDSSLEELDYVPLYWKYLKMYEKKHDARGILRIVQALGQMISLWPAEGLVALSKLVGRTQPTVRRGIIRVLAEAMVRFPAETLLMISKTGGMFSEEEQHQINFNTDSRLSERSFEQLHWSRILYFLNQRDKSGQALYKITDALITSITFSDALGQMMQEVILELFQ